jgi:hypothetical protein
LADERPWTCTDPDGVARRLRGEWYAQLRSSEAPQDLPAGTRLVDALARQTEQRLQDRLVKALVGDQGWFWLVGCWRWLEVVSWCIFGVLAHSLLHLGNFLMGWTGGGVWTPRQGWYTAVKMLHVPLMSLAVFWIFAYATGEDGPLDLVRSNPALIAYAFIFGLFPTLAYDALRKVTENLRKALDSRATTGDTQTIREVAVPAGQPPAPGKPPQFGQLRERLGRIATAPLE